MGERTKYDYRVLTLKEACYENHSLSFSLQRDACVQLRAINGWMALTWLALTLHVLGAIVSLCRWCWRERKYRQREQGAFIASAFCLLGGILWYTGSFDQLSDTFSFRGHNSHLGA